MVNRKCRAKNPVFCPYHGSDAYRDAVKGLSMWEASLNRAEDFEYYENAKKMVDRYRLLVDSTDVGLKKLNKEFRKALRNGTVEEQAVLSERIRLASEKRLKDGEESEWYPEGRLTGEPFHFTRTVFAKAKDSVDGKVDVPIGLTGSSNIAELIYSCGKKGYEIKKIELSPVTSRTRNWEDTDLDAAHVQVMDYIKKNGSADWYEKVLEPNHVVARGITFNMDGKEITVTGSWELTEKIQWRE